MYSKAFFTLLVVLTCIKGVAQSTCTAISVCEEAAAPDSTIRFIRQYNDKNLLVKEVNNMSTEHQESCISTYIYTADDLLKKSVDSSQYLKVVKEYSYKGKKITQVLEIKYTLSTENFNYKEPLFPGDSINATIQPDVRYVWLIDTLIQQYQYNAKGLLIKISKKFQNDIYEYTETFRYDEKDRLIISLDSDRFMYKYYYDTASRIVKKEKYRNSYIDDSGIGPDQKPESVRLKKAVWDLSITNKMIYDTLGRLIQNVEFTSYQAFASFTENHFYDVKGRLYQTTSRQEFADAYFPLCRIDYKYE